METVASITQVIANVTITVVVPLLALFAKRLFDQQLEIVKARNELLKETQYDRALTLLESQRKVFEAERIALERNIDELRQQDTATVSELESARQRLAELNTLVSAFESSAAEVSRDLTLIRVFASDLSLRGRTFDHTIDFSEASFSAPVTFANARFAFGVSFRNADLRNADFSGAVLHGVDLSKAHIDGSTKQGKVRYTHGLRQ